ncbi:MAG: aspartate--tRNA ligase [Clostridia bacterium]|nr:aspartate--tRNA ligase [Clostridia bacterium]
MAETLAGLKRTHYCGTLRAQHIGESITVCGWVQKQRDKGGLIFIDLRDRTGILQLTFDDTTDKAVFEKAKSCRGEYVLAAVGTVRERSSKNPDIPTGDIEIAVTELRILNKAITPPFEITDNCKTAEDIRLKNRYLDLRRPALMKNILFKHQVMQAARRYFSDNGFIEIETPMMIKSTPEGARDYIIPSRVHNGSFYALPQSPQLYKQLLMVSGFDKYFQLARCFRDEDLRADRQPEFTQIDVEMSFVDMEDVLSVGEGFVKFLMKETMGMDIPMPLPRLTYNEAMSRYGSDKPDTRYGMEITDLSDIAAQTEFGVFKTALDNGGSVRGICVKDGAKVYTRKEIDKLVEYVKGIGAKGLAWIRWADEKPTCTFSKFLAEGQLEAILDRMGAEKGDVALIVADKNAVTLPVLGALRQEAAKRMDIIPDTFNFLWVVEFPFFEYNDETQSWDAMHHPFTAPLDDCIQYLDNAPDKVYAKAYDLVLNGIELSSGSIRITDPELQEKMFEALGFTPEQAHEKFGFLTDAFQYGAPPHGGFGIGLDRLVMLMCKAESLRDVVAFPKVKDASEPMTNAPQPVDDAQLAELGIKVIKESK